ncbi:MAG: glycine cleavage system protein R [Thermodesulfobacteriota bacterium]
MKRYALSAIGRDRPGIVAAVTKALYEHDCNIEDSSMTILEDEFAVILIMTMPEEGDEEALLMAMKEVEGEFGLIVNLKELLPPVPGEEAENANYMITLHGADKSGIVYKTAALLAEMGVNITDLETKALGAEGERIYIMMMEVFSPEGTDIKGIEGKLNELGKEIGVTIKIKPVESFEPL